jgi:hypothetical protein
MLVPHRYVVCHIKSTASYTSSGNWSDFNSAGTCCDVPDTLYQDSVVSFSLTLWQHVQIGHNVFSESMKRRAPQFYNLHISRKYIKLFFYYTN